MSDKPSDMAIHCEVVKISLSQSKDGYKLVLALHPDEVPESLLRSLVGTRYMMALVEILHDESIKDLSAPKEIDEGSEAVRYSALLCKDETFQRWMYKKGFARAPDEDSAANALRVVLGIESRSELRTNEAARKEFNSLVEEYLSGG